MRHLPSLCVLVQDEWNKCVFNLLLCTVHFISSPYNRGKCWIISTRVYFFSNRKCLVFYFPLNCLEADVFAQQPTGSVLLLYSIEGVWLCIWIFSKLPINVLSEACVRSSTLQRVLTLHMVHPFTSILPRSFSILGGSRIRVDYAVLPVWPHNFSKTSAWEYSRD